MVCLILCNTLFAFKGDIKACAIGDWYIKTSLLVYYQSTSAIGDWYIKTN